MSNSTLYNSILHFFKKDSGGGMMLLFAVLGFTIPARRGWSIEKLTEFVQEGFADNREGRTNSVFPSISNIIKSSIFTYILKLSKK